MDILLYCVLALLTASLLAAAFWDMTRFMLPNEISYVVAGLWLFTAAFHFSVPILLSHLASGILMFGINFLLWRFRVMGGGDVKLWAATALWFPLTELPQQLLAVSLAGGLVALALVSLRHGFAFYARSIGHDDPCIKLPRTLQVGGPVPYGVAIAMGTIWVMFMAAPGYFAPILSSG